jgi:hypothetical protein
MNMDSRFSVNKWLAVKIVSAGVYLKKPSSVIHFHVKKKIVIV